ncbi:MAG: ABC transporter substrate-binding protein [Hyphomicrobiales bacterium]|nr:MAG: ABC transporter substrate-binding protein [Hyphomicrobiales bacterium]
MNSMKHCLTAAALFVVGAVGTLAWPTAGGAFAAEISIAIGSEPSTLDPQLRDDGGERAINDNIYETLMARTADGALVPGLAAAAPTQVDASTWEFKLRPNVKFSNGEPFDADAVVHSVTRIIDPAFKSEQASYFGTIKSAAKVDDLTVRIVTKGPDPILPSRMYWMKMTPPQHSATADFATNPIGTGPYVLARWDRGQNIVLERNPDYWGDAPAIDRVTYRFIGEPGTRLSSLVAGEVDLITNLLPEFVSSVPSSAAVPGLETSVIVLSTENPSTKDARVRTAMNLAIDRTALADNLFGGFAQPARGQLVNPTAFGFNVALDAYPYDPAKAAALVKEAGAEGATVTIVGESGRWLKDRETIEAVGAYWTAVGLNVDFQIHEFGEYLNQLFDKNHRPDAIFVQNSDELLDADRPMTSAYESGASYASNNDQEMAAKVQAARIETDTTKRAAMYADITAKAYEESYLVPLLNLKDIYGFTKRLEWAPRVDAKLLVKEMQVVD